MEQGVQADKSAGAKIADKNGNGKEKRTETPITMTVKKPPSRPSLNTNPLPSAASPLQGGPPCSQGVSPQGGGGAGYPPVTSPGLGLAMRMGGGGYEGNAEAPTSTWTSGSHVPSSSAVGAAVPSPGSGGERSWPNKLVDAQTHTGNYQNQNDWVGGDGGVVPGSGVAQMNGVHTDALDDVLRKVFPSLNVRTLLRCKEEGQLAEKEREAARVL